MVEILITYAPMAVLILVSMICMIGLIISNIRMTNRALEEEEKQRQLPWTWD